MNEREKIIALIKEQFEAERKEVERKAEIENMDFKDYYFEESFYLDSKIYK